MIEKSIELAPINLIPHRPPMLLLQHVIAVTEQNATATVSITTASPFCIANKGVPSWIGLEYMGQTAALIAGQQRRLGKVEPHLGFLMGTREYTTTIDYFQLDTELQVTCSEIAVVGNSLATFHCTIQATNRTTPLATARLSVLRRPLNELVDS